MKSVAGQQSEDPVPVTSEMIRAGLEWLGDWDREFLGDAERVLTSIYRAMEAKARPGGRVGLHRGDS